MSRSRFSRRHLLSTRRHPLLRGLLQSSALFLASTAVAQSASVWTGAAGDLQWATAANWSAGVPGGDTAIADLSQLDLSADVVLALTDTTVNRLVFGDSVPGGGSWYLGDPLFSYSLTLSGNSPTIFVGDLGTGLVSFNPSSGPLPLRASAGFTKDGPGRLDLAGANTLGGRVVVKAGVLGGATAGVVSGASVVELAGGSLAFGSTNQTFAPALELSASGSLGFGNNSKGLAGAIRGPAGVALTLTQGTGTSSTITLSGGFESFLGELILSNRYFRFDATYVTSHAASGAGTIWTVNTGTTGTATGDGALFYQNGTNNTVTLDFGALRGTGVVRGGAAAGTGTVIYRVGALGLDTAFSGLLIDGLTKAGLTKVGTGTLTLSAANSHTGATLVSAGTLRIDGNQTAATGAVTVATGATLRGSGTLGGALTVSGSLAAGSATTPGTLTLAGGLALNGTALTELRITETAQDSIALINSDTSGATVKTLAQGGTLRLVVAAAAPTGTRTVLTTGANVTRTGAFSGVEVVLSTGTLTLASLGGVWAGETAGHSYTFDPADGGFTLAVTASLSALQIWRQNHFATSEPTGDAADTADPDADGAPNLLEYATGGDPLVAGASPVTLGRDGDGRLTLTFAAVADASLAYEVQASDDLVTWSTVFSATGAGLGAGVHTVADPELLSAHSRRFLRLSVGVAP